MLIAFMLIFMGEMKCLCDITTLDEVVQNIGAVPTPICNGHQTPFSTGVWVPRLHMIMSHVMPVHI